MAKAEISLEELGLDGGVDGKGALTAIPRTPPTYSNIQSIGCTARRGAVCISFLSTHRVCAVRGDELPLESMSAQMEAT